MMQPTEHSQAFNWTLSHNTDILACLPFRRVCQHVLRLQAERIACFRNGCMVGAVDSCGVCPDTRAMSFEMLWLS